METGQFPCPRFGATVKWEKARKVPRTEVGPQLRDAPTVFRGGRACPLVLPSDFLPLAARATNHKRQSTLNWSLNPVPCHCPLYMTSPTQSHPPSGSLPQASLAPFTSLSPRDAGLLSQPLNPAAPPVIKPHSVDAAKTESQAVGRTRFTLGRAHQAPTHPPFAGRPGRDQHNPSGLSLLFPETACWREAQD